MNEEAEQYAIDLIEGIRQKVILAITRARLTAIGVSSLNSELRRVIPQEFTGVSYKTRDYLTRAWQAGIERAGSDRSLPPEIGTMADELSGAFNELSASMIRKITGAVNRALLSATSKDDLITQIGDDTGQGLFASFQARAVGSLTHEVEMAESRAYTLAVEAVGAALALKHTLNVATRGKKLNEKGPDVVKRPVQIKIWYHSQGGNPPRLHHLKMHGKAVMYDQRFTLVNPEAGTYYPKAPHDPALPVGEIISCHCRVTPHILQLTPDEEKDLRARMAASGGLLESDWAPRAVDFKKRMLKNTVGV